MSTDLILNLPQEIYGAFELKKLYPKNFSKGLTVAVIIHAILISIYFIVVELGKEKTDNIPMVRMIKYSDLGPPPTIQETAPQVAVSAANVRPTVGIPVPVPDADVSPEQTIADQKELSSMSTPVITEQTDAGNVQITKDITIDEPVKQQMDNEPGMDEFVAVEQYPEPVVTAQPKYPDLAQKAGIQGVTYVKILVDKDGKPKKAVVIKTDSEMFNEAAVEAAMKFVFKPAIQNNKPIAVWVAIPFRFKLTN